MQTLDENTKSIIKATAPVLAEHGTTITSTMYKNMFARYPDVQTLFNQRHQVVEKGEKFGAQPKALAAAVHAYAANIDNLDVLSSAIIRIAEKHVSTNVKAEHYLIVGEQLIGAIKEVLGDAATPEIINAWTNGYNFLANVFIQKEKEIMEERANEKGGWSGLREFVIEKKLHESSVINSFYLLPQDKGPVLQWKAGQYIGIRINVPGVGEVQRNYSISSAPSSQQLRISVKKEVSLSDQFPHGIVSSHLHQMKEGDSVFLTVPCGEFVLETPTEKKPIVFLSLGVGVTPIIAMTKQALESFSNPIFVIQGARNESEISFKDEFLELQKEYPDKFKLYKDLYKTPKDSHRTSELLTYETISKMVPTDSEYYFLGPASWMLEMKENLLKIVPQQQIHYEFFGPQLFA